MSQADGSWRVLAGSVMPPPIASVGRSAGSVGGGGQGR
jgi:hypothetical protein